MCGIGVVPIALGAAAQTFVTWAHASEQLSRMDASDTLAIGEQARELAVLSCAEMTRFFHRLRVESASVDRPAAWLDQKQIQPDLE